MKIRSIRDLFLMLLLVLALLALDQWLHLPGFPVLFDEADPWVGGESDQDAPQGAP